MHIDIILSSINSRVHIVVDQLSKHFGAPYANAANKSIQLLALPNSIGFRVLVFVFPTGFRFLFAFLVPFALYLQQIRTRICHFAWYLLHCGMVTLHFAWYLLHLAMFAFHFAWYLPRFGTSTSHLHGICYILVLQTFMWDSLVLL